ncbi:MAG TPA: bifunctional nuclease family protein [Thermomicrobiales bacterium]|nr:bifunctional nuclease family protein [Thermomicrobiales bacterium]
MIETVVKSIRFNRITNNRVVLLKETAGERYLPIWIGEFEAHAIAMELQGVEAPRPLPYDLMRAMLSELGGSVEHVFVNDLSMDVFYARVVVSVNGRTIELDSRPSDAIALAVRSGATIFVDESVMDRAGVNLDDDDAPLDAERSGSSSPVEQRAEPRPDDEKLSIFRDFINTLDSDEFDRGRGD